MEKGDVFWTFSLNGIYGFTFGIEHMTADDNVSWMIAIHLGFLRILIEKVVITEDPEK